MTNEKKMKIEFAPGAFDAFEGSQEELDELMIDIQTMVESGALFEQSEPVDMMTMLAEEPEQAIHLLAQMGNLDDILIDMESDSEISRSDMKAILDLVDAMGIKVNSKNNV